MKSLAFPDVNVWLALLLEDHASRRAALRWWNAGLFEVIAFSRFTQMSVLRLLTTAAAMNNQPLTMAAAWRAHDRLFEDRRVTLLGEPAALEDAFRKHTSSRLASPKVWADAYLLAFTVVHGGSLITFDNALSRRSQNCVLLVSSF